MTFTCFHIKKWRGQDLNLRTKGMNLVSDQTTLPRIKMAHPAGLEPATPGSEDRRSNPTELRMQSVKTSGRYCQACFGLLVNLPSREVLSRVPWPSPRRSDDVSKWWTIAGLNRRPPVYQTGALTHLSYSPVKNARLSELSRQSLYRVRRSTVMVEHMGFEPICSISVQGRRPPLAAPCPIFLIPLTNLLFELVNRYITCHVLR